MPQATSLTDAVRRFGIHGVTARRMGPLPDCPHRHDEGWMAGFMKSTRRRWQRIRIGFSDEVACASTRVRLRVSWCMAAVERSRVRAQ
jgi:hypothetical protein